MPIDLAAATQFVWCNARLVDRRVFERRFLGGNVEDVVHALRGYQNADGGFGHALEPDLRGPESQPIHVDMALRVLHESEADAPEMVARACSYLATLASPVGGVPAILPSVLEHPRAQHWEPEFWTAESLNPTAMIAGLLHAMRVAHIWLDRADHFCWQRLATVAIGDGPTLAAAFSFLNHAADRKRAEQVADIVAPQIPEATFFSLQPATTSGYALTPLHLAPTPQSMARRYFEDALLEAHLDRLEAGQGSDGGWPLTWEPPSTAAAMAWRGRVTVEALVTLQRWGRL
jgi:hypothetical protein